MESLQSLLEPHVHMSNAMPLVRVTNGKREATPRWQLRSSRASVVRMARVRIGMTTWYRRLKNECPDVKNGKVRSDVCDYCNQWDRSISRKIKCSVVQIKLDLESVDALYFDGFNAPAAHEDISVAVLEAFTAWVAARASDEQRSGRVLRRDRLKLHQEEAKALDCLRTKSDALNGLNVTPPTV